MATIAPSSSIDFKSFDEIVAPIVAKMTLAEKVGQMTQAELSALKSPEEITELMFGSILSGGNSDPEDGNSREAWSEAYANCQQQALKTNLGLPLLYGIDAVHGHNNVLDAIVFPHNIGLGCANDPELTEEIGRVTAREVRATGIEWTFAPCITVPRDDRWGRTYEGFSEDPERVAVLGAAMVRGLQGEDLRDPESVLSCIKHWVGDGGTVAEVRDSPFHEEQGLYLDQGDTRCDEEELRSIHISPYLPSLKEGAGSVMVSYSSWNGLKCTASKQLITDILKEELAFDGFVISDYNAIDQCDPDYKTAIGLCINAGIDMAMVANRHREFIENLTELVEEGVIPMERIDDAVTRILRVKAAMGLLDAEASSFNAPFPEYGFGSEEHRAVSREAVQKSLVVLKNESALPLSKELTNIHVAGAAAEDMGIQCGGWTIGWQGEKGEVTTGGTTLLEGIRSVASDANVTHSATADGGDDADAVIVIVGEGPYAEGIGDNENPSLTEEEQAMIAQLSEGDRPLILVIVSGRPLLIPDDTLAAADAIVAAWLPGTEGDGVADVLFGDAPATGTLSFTWPRNKDQHPINVGDEEYDPLFPFGHGIQIEAAE